MGTSAYSKSSSSSFNGRAEIAPKNSAANPAPTILALSDQAMIGLLDYSRDCVKILGLDGSLDFLHCGGSDALEQKRFKGMRGQIWWSLWPEHTQGPLKDAFEKARAGRETEFLAECPTVQGNRRSWNLRLKPMLTDDGSIAGVVCTSRDTASQ